MLDNECPKWKHAAVPVGCTVEDAVKNLNASKLKIVLVVDKDRLVGTITDGDIRRGLLSGVTLQDSVFKVTTTEPFVVSPSLHEQEALELMRVNKVYQLPIVDENREIVGLHMFDQLAASPINKLDNAMLIMAGGKGTRLRPHTENCPKPLLDVAGKPMLQHIIEKAQSEGFQKFIISLHYLGHMIQDFFGNGRKFGVEIEYITEESPLGTAGALSLLDNSDMGVPFIVTNGDVLTDMSYRGLLEFHLKNKAAATMAVRAHRWENPFGVVKVEGVDLVGFEEKPVVYSHINAGVYVLSPSSLNYLQSNQYCDMPTLFTRLKDDSCKTIVYPMHESWLDVGRHDDFELAQTQHIN